MVDSRKFYNICRLWLINMLLYNERLVRKNVCAFDTGISRFYFSNGRRVEIPAR